MPKELMLPNFFGFQTLNIIKHLRVQESTVLITGVYTKMDIGNIFRVQKCSCLFENFRVKGFKSKHQLNPKHKFASTRLQNIPKSQCFTSLIMTQYHSAYRFGTSKMWHDPDFLEPMT